MINENVNLRSDTITSQTHNICAIDCLLLSKITLLIDIDFHLTSIPSIPRAGYPRLKFGRSQCIAGRSQSFNLLREAGGFRQSSWTTFPNNFTRSIFMYISLYVNLLINDRHKNKQTVY